MNILWITNIPFPAASHLLGLAPEIGGGWMHSLAMQLTKEEGINLAVATTYLGKSMLQQTDGNIQYYLIPRKKNNTEYDSSLELSWARIVENFKPEVIHIHGTEYAHGLACMEACKNQRYIISIQGMISVYSEYHFSGIKPCELMKFTTLNDLKRRDTIFQSKRKLEQRSKYELEYIKRTKHIIGRTKWDYAHTKTINPNMEYHFCNEVLRNSFYNVPRWSIETKRNHTIFMSQANSQRQGLHQVLKALSIIKDVYPDVSLRVAGIDISGGKKWVHRIGTYGHYIRSMVNSLSLNDRVEFLGGLNEESMAEEFRNAHIFVCASAIENSPNSLGEAQIIGTPCIASFVGGIPDMVDDQETGLLYRFEEYKMLAFKIMEVFHDAELTNSLSENGQTVASERHNREVIGSRMREIYESII